MLDELFLLLLFNFHPFLHDISELSFKEFVCIHILQFLSFFVFKRFKEVFAILNKVTDPSEGSFLSFLILLNIEESCRSFQEFDLLLVMFEGVVDHIGCLKFHEIESGLLDLFVAISIKSYQQSRDVRSLGESSDAFPFLDLVVPRIWAVLVVLADGWDW